MPLSALNLTDGRTFDVRHPNLMMVGARTFVVGIPQQGVDDPLYERSVTVSLLHVVSMEPLETSAAAQQGNGEQT